MWFKNEPILGVVQPIDLNELFYGFVGKGAWHGKKKIMVSKINNIKNAVLATGFPSNRSYEEKSLLKTLEEIKTYKKVRMLGCASLMLCYVACGKFDVYEEEDIHWWDVAAGLAIVKAAGGSFTVKKSTTWHQISTKASNGLLNVCIS